MPVSPEALASALLVQRAELHSALWPRAVLLAALVVAVLLVLVWQQVPNRWVAGWLALWALVMALRVAVGLAHRRALARGAAAPEPWLRRYRAAFALHGLVWALAALLLPARLDAALLDLLIFALTTMTVGVVITTGFDMWAGGLFAAPTLLVLVVQLLSLGRAGPAGMALMMLVFVLIATLGAQRSRALLRDSLRARLAADEQQRAVQAATEQASRAQLALRDHERLTNAITDMVAVLGEDRRYRIVNDAWCRTVGIGREQALGLDALELLDNHADPEREKALRECIEQQAPRTVMNWVRLRGTAPRLLETTFTPFFSTVDGVRCAAVVSRDVSERESARAALQRAEAEQRSLLDAFPGHIACLSQDMVYTYINRSLATLLGREPAQIVGRGALEVLGPERLAQLMPYAQRALGGETVTVEHRHRLPDGRPGPYSQMTLTPARDPRSGAPAIVGFAVDITARKQAERALRQARDEAQSANQAKSQFLSQMSHELRTPLNAILGFGQLLQSDPQQPPAPHQAPWVDAILRGAQHLLDLINQILDLGRIEAGQMALDSQAVPLGTLAQECSALVQPLAQQHGVTLLPPLGPWAQAVVRADRTRLKQVLLNLLGNAIKYNRSAGTVQLECRAQAGTVWMAVHDSGAGIPASQQQRLFQPFERLGAAQTTIEGTGIGLALCRGLVQAMGGQLGVNSSEGVGSSFWLQLPVAELSGPAAAPTASTALADVLPAARPRHVLYIEDNPVNLVLMQAMLARLPEVRLATAAEPLQGLALAVANPPELILLDIQLPGIDGFEVLRRLRQHSALQAVPVVAVSANAMASDIEAARVAGFTTYLTKPLSLELLLRTVRRLLEEAGPGADA
jgi:PAS domain S-box-containing protein